MRALCLLLVVILTSVSWTSRADAPNDELMGLVPTDMAVVLVLDRFRERSREILDSDLVRELSKLPTVRSWFESEKGKGLIRARAEIEAALGVTLAQLRDDVLGDSVVLALHLKPGSDPDEAAGLFLTRARNRVTLDSLIESINKAERAEGILKEVVDLPQTPDSPIVHHRRFRPNSKPDEWYCLFADGTFAWSNSERLVLDVVERKGRGDGLRQSTRYTRVRNALPANAVARLYVDPSIVLRVASTSKTPADAHLLKALGGLDYIAAAVEWRDGPIFHFHESLNAEVSTTLRFLFEAEPIPADVFGHVPRTAIAVAAWRWDLPGLFDVMLSYLPEADRPRAEAAQAAIQGLLMGKNLRSEVLLALKPGGLAYVDIPEPHGMPALVATIDVMDRPEVSAALENALRTVAALSSLDKERKQGPIRIETSDRDSLRVTRLANGTHSPCFASNANHFVIGSNEVVVRHVLTKPSRPVNGNTSLERLRSLFFPNSQGFLAADLVALHRYALANRETLVRGEAETRGGKTNEAAREFQRVLDLIEPFEGAFASWDRGADGRSLHQVIGLVGRKDRGAR